MPDGRPYSLGNTSQDLASINATSEISASSRARPSAGRYVENPRAVSYETVSYASDARYVPGVRPVNAYAPVDRRGPSELLAGRGLY